MSLVEGEEEHFCQLKLSWKMGEQTVFLISAASHLPSAHNNSYTKVASFGTVHSDALHVLYWTFLGVRLFSYFRLFP